MGDDPCYYNIVFHYIEYNILFKFIYILQIKEIARNGYFRKLVAEIVFNIKLTLFIQF